MSLHTHTNYRPATTSAPGHPDRRPGSTPAAGAPPRAGGVCRHQSGRLPSSKGSTIENGNLLVLALPAAWRGQFGSSLRGMYHVMARGIERRVIFRDDQDRRRFLERLKGRAVRGAGVGVLFDAELLSPADGHAVGRLELGGGVVAGDVHGAVQPAAPAEWAFVPWAVQGAVGGGRRVCATVGGECLFAGSSSTRWQGERDRHRRLLCGVGMGVPVDDQFNWGTSLCRWKGGGKWSLLTSSPTSSGG